GTEVLWARPFILGQYYPNGWADVLGLNFMGAQYTATGAVVKKPGGTGLIAEDTINGNATLKFSGAQLTENIEKTVSISPTNVVTEAPDPAAPTFSLTLTPASGDIGGSFIHTDDSPLTFKGIIYQK